MIKRPHTDNNKKTQTSAVCWPVLPEKQCPPDELAIYNRFLKHVRHVPHSRIAIRILSSIQFTADFLDYSDAHIAKQLVDWGLRAPRMAFPEGFLKFADACLLRSGWDVGGPNLALLELREYWNKTGEDQFNNLCNVDYSLMMRETTSA